MHPAITFTLTAPGTGHVNDDNPLRDGGDDVAAGDEGMSAPSAENISDFVHVLVDLKRFARFVAAQQPQASMLLGKWRSFPFPPSTRCANAAPAHVTLQLLTCLPLCNSANVVS